VGAIDYSDRWSDPLRPTRSAFARRPGMPARMRAAETRIHAGTPGQLKKECCAWEVELAHPGCGWP